jgi:uridine kinase
LGVAGGSGCGKSHLVQQIQSRLPDAQVAVLPQDAYYHDRSNLELAARKAINFDAPEAIDFDLMIRDLDALIEGQRILLPDYDYWACRRSPGSPLDPAPIVVVEGILVLGVEALRQRMDYRLFIDIPEDLRLIQLVQRDKAERGRSAEDVLDRYQATVGPMHHLHVLPSRRHADWIWTRFDPGESPWPMPSPEGQASGENGRPTVSASGASHAVGADADADAADLEQRTNSDGRTKAPQKGEERIVLERLVQILEQYLNQA